MLSKLLVKVGLSPGEASVYLACLKLGTQDVATLATETGLSRKDTIMLLASLVERGFVSKFASQKDFFTAEHPEILVKILENNKYTMEEGIKEFSNLLPRFTDYMNPAFTKPEIAFYEGSDGVIAAYEDTLTSKTDIQAIASIEDIESYFPKYLPKYYKRRRAAGIHIYAIFPDEPKARKRMKQDKDEMRTSMLIPGELMDFHMELNIYDDKVAYFSIKEKLAVIVQSAIIADSMRNVFKLCWKMGEMYSGKKGKKKTTKKKTKNTK